MKNIILIAILFTSTLCFGQLDSIQKPIHSFTLGVDISNTIKGGTVNGRALDFQLKYSLETVRQGVEIGVIYERFPKLNFEFFGMTSNKVFKRDRIHLVAGLEQGVIHRWRGLLFPINDSHTYTYTYGVNGEIRYTLNERWSIGLQHNLRRRLDIGTKWIGSNWFNLRYEIQRKNKYRKINIY